LRVSVNVTIQLPLKNGPDVLVLTPVAAVDLGLRFKALQIVCGGVRRPTSASAAPDRKTPVYYRPSGAMDLQRASLLAARRRDAATVQLVCWRSRRQVPGLGNSRPHGFCARGCGALLGFYAPIVAASFLPFALGGSKRGLVRAKIASRSCSAMTARRWIANLVAVGDRSTRSQPYIAMNARLREASAIYVLDLTEVDTEEP